MEKRRVDLKTLATRLRRLRGIRNRTGVARELHISYSALSFYEDGVRFPSEANQQKIADYYGVSVDELFYTTE